MTTKPRPPRFNKKSDRMITPGASAAEIRCDMACAPLDNLARHYDAIWGIDRLVTLVSPAMAEKYGAAIAHLHSSYDAEDPAATVAAAANCMKGLDAMNAQAIAAGHQPADPRVWMVEIEGHKYGFVEDAAFVAIAERNNPGVKIATLRQAVVALNPERFGMARDIIAAFPGATITAIRPRSQLAEELNDEIPW